MAERLDSRYVKSGPKRTAPVTQHEIHHTDESSFILNAGVPLKDGCLVLLDKANRNIKLLDEKYNAIDTMPLKTIPFDVCVSNRKCSEVYVTEPETETVHCIAITKTILRTYLRLVASFPIFEDCRGITCWKSGVALTVMKDGFKGTLGLLNYDFKIKKKVFESVFHRNLFKAPWHIETVRNGSQVIVSDQGNHTITCLDCDTLAVIFTVTSLSGEPLHGPRSLTRDADDNIYVIVTGARGGQQAIVKLTADGRETRFRLIESRGHRLNCPSGIMYCAGRKSLLFQGDRTKSSVWEYKL